MSSEAREIRLVALDIDGTLVGADGRIGSENLQAVRRLLDEGVEIVLASGRNHGNMLPFHTELGLASPLVSVHGAVVREPDGTEYEEVLTLADSLVTELTQEGRRLGTSVLYYRHEGVFLERHTVHTERDQALNAVPHQVVGDLLVDRSGIHKVLWMAEPEVLGPQRDRAQQMFGGRADLYSTDPTCLEFVVPGVNKAVGVGLVAERRGISPAQVAAFGDGNNDAPMLAWAGLGVAMAHATPAAKAAARFVGPEAPVNQALARAIAAVFWEY